MQDNASSRSEIERFEAQLVRDPDSHAFARLSRAYLEAGLIDQALHTARQGVSRYPQYVAGQRALAFACYAKGLEDQCCLALEAVTAALPEELESQKMFAKLLVSTGQNSRAMQVYRTILDFYPDEDDSRAELESLKSEVDRLYGGFDATGAEFGTFEDEDEEIIEDIEILEMEDDDVLEEEDSEIPVPASPTVGHHDPLSTATLAELYVQQGFYDKALVIYRAMSAEDRADIRIKSRIEELEIREAASTAIAAVPVAPPTQLFQEDDFSAPVSGSADNALATLKGWLDNVRRVKSCR